ncbi:MAG: biopolymer transporter ExbD [Gammaproteobacteria bacterium]|nr:MAG: biopolymer transporter ExbD [Gammaproteobacteria bacterium]TDJ40690.1 MAG: biopolymer transporter ExbD [Gammaproteobacteria bacterium]
MTAHRLKLRRDGQKKRTRGASLNLVSLMDIFTILVFFLMVNSSEVEVLQTTSNIVLPDSSAEKRPKNQLMITVSDTDLMVSGRSVANVAELRNDGASTIAGLQEELAYQASRKGSRKGPRKGSRKGVIPEDGFAITIMGDREIPYWLLKKIMLTCQLTDFARISLAVNKIETDDPQSNEGSNEALVGSRDGAAS